ncbi:MAG: DUF459 domain-containing protein [Bradymonadia bacterium]
MTTNYTIRDSIIISLLSLIGGALVNSQVLVEWADRMEFGAAREYALSATQSIDMVAKHLHINQPQANLRVKVDEWRSQSFSTIFKKETRFRVTVRNATPTMHRARKPVPTPPKIASNIHKPRPENQSHFIANTFGTVQYDVLTYQPMKPAQLQIVPKRSVNSNQAAKLRAAVSSQFSKNIERPSEKKPSTPSKINNVEPRSERSQLSMNEERKPNVLIVGDSLMGGVGPRLKRLLRKEHGFPNPKLKWKASTGLSRPDYFDWPKTLNALLAEKEYDVVVAIFGTNDTQPVSVNRKSYRYGTKAWFEHYRKRVVKVLEMMCKSGNRSVFWIGLPTMRSESFNEKIVKMNQLYREELNRSECGQYIPMDKILSPDGQFTSYLKVGKKRRKVRAGDGIHLSFVGYDYVARRVIDTILAQTSNTQAVEPQLQERAL